MTRRVRALIHGKVQQVGFRWFIMRQATGLGLDGWVRNLDDPRSVELEAEGDDDAVERLLEAARIGPRSAKVTSVEVEDLQPTARQGVRSFLMR